MKDKDKFSVAAVISSAVREFSERKREQLLKAFGLLGFGIILVFCIFWGCHEDYASPERNLTLVGRAVVLALGLGYVGLSVFSTFSASMMLPQLVSKERRIAFFMIPEGILEKYLGQLIFYVFGFTLLYLFCMIVGFVAGMSLAAVCFPDMFVFPEGKDVVMDVCQRVFDDIDISGIVVAVFAIIPLMVSSFFVAGSAFFGKYSFVKTYVALWVLQSFCGLMFGLMSFLSFPGINMTLGHGYDTLMASMAIGLAIVVTLFNWWIGYYRLRETDSQ